jgi:hypothetical protein
MLYYSNLGPTGVPLVPGVWDNIMLRATLSVDQQSVLTLLDGRYTSMVVLYDGSNPVLQDSIMLAVRDVGDRGRNNINVYNFSQDIAVGVPSLIRADMTDVYDETKDGNAALHGFQLGLTAIAFLPVPGGLVPEVLLYKEMMAAMGVAYIKDFVLLHRPYTTLGQGNAFPFYHVPLECSVGDIFDSYINPVAPEYRFHPTVHYSNMYMMGGWNTVVDQPWFPYNVYHHLKLSLVPDPMGELPTAGYSDAIIINQKPPYRVGSFPT